MKKSLLNILACPICKKSLELDVTEDTREEVISGILRCGYCKEDYPIENSIPNLLPPSSRA